MAKVKGYLANSTGKIGNLTFYHNSASGDTIVREVVDVKNPKTRQQRIQRVIAKTSVLSYKAMKEIVDHSFEGKTMGAQCMNRFNQLNMRYFRNRAAEIVNSGGNLSEFYNFARLSEEGFAPAAVYVSEGSLPTVPSSIVTVSDNYRFGMEASANTYKAIIDDYDLQRGDQLTFCYIGKNAISGKYMFKYARVILDPRNEDGSSASLSEAFIVDGAINKANFRNKGLLDFLQYEGTTISFGARLFTLVASAIIVSRKGNDYWFRSNAKMVLSEEAIGEDLTSLWDASEEETTQIDILNDEAYLNNAGVGGEQSTSPGGEPSPEPGDETPVYSNTVVINGISQNVSGGSVRITGTLTSIVVTGTNLESGSLKLQDGLSEYTPTSETSSRVEWTGLSINPTSGGGTAVYKEGMVWFTISADGSHDGGDDG